MKQYIHETRPQHRELRPLLFAKSEWFINVPQSYLRTKVVRRG